jgi:hypothetical protein
MGVQAFLEQLKRLGHAVQELGEGRILFPYTIPTGRLAGQQIQVGFQVPNDFPITPPSGLHVSPRLLPHQSGGVHPTGGIHDSGPFGAGWQYWSRPISHWAQTKREVRDVMAHVRHLFDTL